MTNPWDLYIDSIRYADSVSDQSALMVSPPRRDVVPLGTVASRILDLQTRARQSTGDRAFSPIGNRRENSRTGFGRRTLQSFGQPASRSSKPNEHLQIEAQHSFLGHATKRANHLEEHALVDAKLRWDRNLGLHGQLQPSGLSARVQYEGMSPWSHAHNGNYQQDTTHEYSPRQVETPRPNSQSGQLDLPATTALLLSSSPCDGADGARPMDKTRGDQNLQEDGQARTSRSRMAEMSGEWTSVETTSTIRRQSVRDLYKYYGIQRPAGLASPERLFNDPEETPRLLKGKKCGACSRINPQNNKYCRCGHELERHNEINLLPNTVGTQSQNTGQRPAQARASWRPLKGERQKSGFKDLDITGRQPVANEEQARNHFSSHYETSYHSEADDYPQYECAQSQDIVQNHCPSLRLEKSPRDGSDATARNCANVPAASRPGKASVRARHVTSSVECSPVIVSETGPPAISVSLLPVVTRHQGLRRLPGGHYHRRKRRHASGSQSDSSSEVGTDNLLAEYGSVKSCTIHSTIRPHRGGLLCVKRRRRHRGDTDSGYIASASYLDEPDVQHGGHFGSAADNDHQCSQLHHGSVETKCFHRQPSLHHQHKCGAHKHSAQHGSLTRGNIIREVYSPHASRHLDSPPVFNVVCKLQQRTNSCQCAACQETPTNVRYHVHEDHWSTTHHHLTPQKEDSETSKLMAKPDAAHAHKPPPTRPPLPPVHHSLSEVVVPTPRKKATSPTWIGEIDDVTSQGEIEEERRESMAPPRRESMSPREIPREKTPTTVQSVIKTPQTPLKAKTNPQLAPEPPSMPQKSSSLDQVPSSDPATPDTQEVHPPSGTSSPRKSQPTSRRLSAFIKLHEQNIVPLLNKRLQAHQDELRQIGKLCAERIEVGERIGRREEERRKIDDETRGGAKKSVEEGTEQKTANGEKTDKMEMVEKKEKEEVVEESLAEKEVERSDAGIKGITIVIHLEGRKDVVFKANLDTEVD